MLPLSAAGGDLEREVAVRLETRLTEPRFSGAQWGVKVVSLDSGRTRFEHQAGKLFTPASNAKLFTAALALRQLGSGFRIRTSLYGEHRPGADGILRGDLVLYGRGDPSLMGRDRGGADPLASLAEQLWAAGVRSVEGDLVGDDSFFAVPPYGTGWECEDLPYGYGAEPSALCIHDNAVDLRVYPAPREGMACLVFPMPGLGVVDLDNRTTTKAGPAGVQVTRGLGETGLQLTGSLPPGGEPAQMTVTIHDPALFCVQLFRRALLRRGITVRGTVRAMHAPQRPEPPDLSRWTELGHLDSPPLAALVQATLKRSLNLDAELLLLQAGAARPGPGPNTENKGVAALKAFLAAAGLKPDEVLLEEGSGLSRANLVTPAAVVDLLVHMAHSPEAAAFMGALPVAGVDGTLQNRLEDPQALGQVQAKTGTLRYVAALSGYGTTAAGERLAFSLLLNNYRRDPKGPTAQAELDAIVASLLTF